MPTALPSRAQAAPASRSAARMPRFAAGLLRFLLRGSERQRQRRALADLDQRLLDDVGLTRRQADRECRKPPWL